MIQNEVDIKFYTREKRIKMMKTLESLVGV